MSATLPPVAERAPSGAPEPLAAADAAEPASVLSASAYVVRHRRLLVALPLLLALLTLAYTLREPTEYASVTSFFVQKRETPGLSGGLASVASQFGVNLGGGQGEGSPEFLKLLVHSRRVLENVAARPLDAQRGPTTVARALADEAGRPELATREAAAGYLRKHVKAVVDPGTGVTELTVRAPSGPTATAIAGMLVDEINRFHIESQQARASRERQFLDARLENARAELRVAEGRYRDFLEGNREVRNSPELILREQQIQRDVGLRQGLVMTLAQSLEQTKIDEVRSSPMVTTLDRPSLASGPVGRGLVLRLALAVVLGLFLALLTVLARALFGDLASAGGVEADELRDELREARGDLRRPWRLVLPGGRPAADRSAR